MTLKAVEINVSESSAQLVQTLMDNRVPATLETALGLMFTAISMLFHEMDQQMLHELLASMYEHCEQHPPPLMSFTASKGPVH